MATLFHKQYNSPEQLVQLLQRRGLVIDSPIAAVQKLRRIGYYRFSAYLYPFLMTPKKCQMFKPNSHFLSALSLYEFDQNLRSLAFGEIAKIEVAIRSAIANIVARESENMFWITDKAMYANEERYHKTKCIIDKELASTKEEFIAHFKNKYSNPYPPAWMLVEILPMGVLNHIYGNLANNAIRKKVASEFSLSVPVFSSWLTIVVLTRNACCHHARVWNKENAIPPMEPRKINKAWLVSLVPNKRFFFNLCILKYFINIIDKENDMTQKIERLLCAYPNVDIAPMGFPANWQNEPVWQDASDRNTVLH